MYESSVGIHDQQSCLPGVPHLQIRAFWHQQALLRSMPPRYD